MNIPTFRAGETLTADKLNKLCEALREIGALAKSAAVTDVHGGTFTRSRSGTTLSLARGFLQGGGGNAASSGDEDGSPFERVLFNWKAAEVPGGSEGENPTGKITVSAGLVLVRPNSASGAAARSPSVIVSPAEGLGKASVKVPKYAAEFLPEFSSEFSVLTGAELNESSEPAVRTEISVDVSVPGYTLTKTGSTSVLAGISTGSRAASVAIPAQTATSSSEYVQSATLMLYYEQLTAQPGSAADWTRNVVTQEAGSHRVSSDKSRVTVTIPQATASATVSGVVTGTTSTSVPSGYKLEETGEASTKTAKVAVELPDKILETTAEKFRPLGGGAVELIQSGEETLALDIEGAGEIGSAKLAGEKDLDANASAGATAGDSGDKTQLCRVEGAEFSWGGGEKIVFLDVTGSTGGSVSFTWRMDDLSAAAGSTEYFSDNPQTLYLNVRAETVSAGDGEAAADAISNVESRIANDETLNSTFATRDSQLSDGEAAEAASDAAQAFRVRAELASPTGFSEWQVSVPMAYVCAGTGGAPHVEPLTWGCVEVTPPVRVVLNDGYQTETAAAAAFAVSALAEAADYALATAEQDAYGLETRDFF